VNAGGRLAAFATGLVVAFTASYTTAEAIAPDREATQQRGHRPEANSALPAAEQTGTVPAGLSLAQNGYALSAVRAPRTPRERGALSFTIADPAGEPLLDYASVHDKQLHLIVVRSDGTRFAHVHPTLDRDGGTWSTPWTWNAAGTYRVFADFQPAAADSAKVTLSRTVEVAGEVIPAPPVTTRTVDEVAGYTVRLDGALTAGVSRTLTATITRNGQPVTTLQPYLGAFGHLVALRDGDLAYLHVHPEDAEPAPGRTGGPAVTFAATAPTAGRYLLFLDFQIGDAVHTAAFVVDAARGDTTPPPPEPSHDDGH
jgi:hypothetical protein